jgi:hypothetical protein
MNTFTRTALTQTEFAEVMSTYRVFREAPKTDWEMAHALDVAGDRFKAAGNLKAAQACYSRALARATKAHNAA